MKKWLTKTNARWTIAIISALTILFGFLAYQVQFTYDHERYFSQEGKDFEIYNRYKSDFLSSDTRTVLAIELNENLFTYSVLSRLRDFTDSLSNLDLVEEVVSIDNLKFGVKSPTGITQVPFIDIDDPQGYRGDSIRLVNTDNVVGGLVDSTFTIVTIQVYTNYHLDKNETDSYIQEIENTLQHFGFDHAYIGGRLINKAHILDKMKVEMGLFVIISFFLVLIVLGIVFRSVWGIVVPILVVISTAIWTVGLMSLFGKEIDMLSSLIPSILFIVGISDVIHIYNKYLDGLRRSYGKTESIYRAYKQVGKATFITSITTSIGFLSLIIAALRPMWEFGVYTAAGVMIAFLLSFSLFPAFLILLPTPKVIAFASSKNVWREFLGSCYNWVASARRGIIFVSILLLIGCVFAVSQLKIDNFLTEELPDSDPLKQSFVFFEEHFNGMRTFDLAVEVKDTTKNIFDYDIILQIEQLDNYLKTEYMVGNIVSPVLLVKQCNQINAGGNYLYNVVPDEQTYHELDPILKRLQRLKYFESICHENQKEARISGNITDEGGHAHIEKNEALIEYAALHAPDLNLHLTGLSHLIDINNHVTTFSLLKSLSAALLVIGLLMSLLYRSPKMILIAILPNILPLLLIGLVMYLTNIDLKVVTALIFTVAFGITVDDTIHLLGNLRIELKDGLPFEKALRHTFITTGKSIILTTLILFFGFISLTVSEFSASFYFGLLVSFGLLFAVIVDLTLLPALLLTFNSREKKKDVAKSN